MPCEEEWASFRFSRKAIPSPGLQHTQDHPAVLESSINQPLSCFACKTLARCSAEPLRCHLLSHGCAEPDVESWALPWPWLSHLQLCSLPSSADREQSCLSFVVSSERRDFLACTCLLCSSTEPHLKAIVVFAPYGGNK